MVTEILWGDGTSDKIYLTYTAASGSQTVLVSSDANAGPARTKDITFVSSIGNIARVLTVIQETNMDYVSITWNDTCITFNDTGIAYPYVEPYIVFADPVVEQICATTWGDGTGLKPSQAAQVTNIGITFQSNTDIESFNELVYFTGLTTFSNYAFRNCTALEEITIPPNVRNNATAISGLFNGCTSLQKVYGFEELNLSSYGFNNTPMSEVHVSSLDGYLKNTMQQTSTPFYSSTAETRGLYVNGTLVTSITIPNTFSSLSGYLFMKNNTLASATFPSTFSVIPAELFNSCTISEVNLPSTITEIQASAFMSSNLEQVPVLDGLVSAGNNAFYNCTYMSGDIYLPSIVTMGSNAFRTNSGKIGIVDIGQSCVSIGTYAFTGCWNASNKGTIIVRATIPPTLATNNSLGSTSYINKIYVPNGTLSDYQSASNWSSYANYMVELNPDGTIPT